MQRRKYIFIDGKKIFLDDSYKNEFVNGSGLTIYGIEEDQEVIVKQLNDDERFCISNKPIVQVKEFGSQFYENVTSFKKFISYIDICPQSATQFSKDVVNHMNDTNAFVLPHSYDIDPSGFNTFYSENYSSLVGINRMEFIQLCTLTLQKMLKDNSISKINFHQMSIVCACYSSVMNYQIIPTESIQSKIKFIIRN